MIFSRRRLFTLFGLLLTLSLVSSAQFGYERARSLVGRVQRNLRRAERFARAHGKERERYDNAQRHLSQFDYDMSRGKFDKDRLDEAIDDVKNVVKNNTLSPEARDILTRNLEELRQMRAARGRV
jgi:hypothetical protein